MSPHPLHSPPNIALRLLRGVFSHVAPELLHFALFGLDPRDSYALAHLAAYGFGLVG